MSRTTHRISTAVRLALILLTLSLAFLGTGCRLFRKKSTPTPQPTATKRPKPTFTPVQMVVVATNTPIPPPRPVVPVPEPKIPTPAATPTAKPPSGEPQTASSGSVSAKPKGSSLMYEHEYPGPSPKSDPPALNEHTNPLSGRHVDDSSMIRRRPILVRYGNDSGARPHAGISQAEVVMEDVMDAWWITRITAVFLQQEPKQVGPIRSARPANIDSLPAFDGVFVYSGASIGVTKLLAEQGFDTIHEGRGGDVFFRGQDKPAPHNLYTSIPTVREKIRSVGVERPATLRGFTFSASAPGGESASRIDIPYPKTSTVAWTWDAGAGVYRRWVTGDRYVDSLTGQQVGFENVVVLYAKHWESDIVEDSRGSTAIGIALRGGERVHIFRDGRAIKGYWYRKDANMLWQFIDEGGNHIPLKPGNTWIQFVPNTYTLGIS